MKEMLTLIYLTLNLLLGITKTPASIYDTRQASSYIIVDSYNGNVLEGKNYYSERSVASISKIMTAILVIENTDLKNKIIVTDDIRKAYGSAIYITVGSELTIEELVYGLMLRSGNDAAIMLSLAVCENEEDFINLMNLKAIELGMKNSLFRNQHGLDEDDGGNISTAYDMAILMSYSMKNPIFAKISSTRNYKSELKGNWKNKNRLLDMYTYANGGKTGYTKKAKRTLVTSAKKDGMELVIVTLNCGDDFNFHKNLYNKYFNNYQQIIPLRKGETVIYDYRLYVEHDIKFIIEKGSINKYKLLLEILKEDGVANISLIDNDFNVLAHYECKILGKESETVKVPWWQKFLNWLGIK